MARRPASFSRVAQPVRSIWHRFAFGLLITAAFALMLVGKADILLIERARVTVGDAVTPILEALSEPAATVSQAIQRTQDFMQLHDKLVALEAENARLRNWREVAQRLDAENLALRRIAAFVPPPNARFVSGRIIADSGGPFVHSALLNVGERHGVRRGLAVVSDTGFVGSIVEVGQRHSRVLLITDLNSQVPVLVEQTRDPAVAIGQNTDRLKLQYLPQNADVSPGDRIVTSGHGGMFPAGLALGVVTSVSDRGVTMKPTVDYARLEYVRLLDYNLEGVVGGTKAANRHTVLPIAPEDRAGKQSR
jgi:rod shape-determining protein MreC